MPVTCPASITRRALFILVALISVFSVRAAHASSPVGINMAPVYFHNTEWVFVDAMKASSGWVPQLVSGGPWDTGAYLAQTADGYPLLASGQAAACVMFVDIGGHYPGGNYVCLYDGSGTIEFGGDAHIVSQTPGRIVVGVTPSNSGIVLRVTASNSGNPVRNIRMIMPGFEATYLTQPFHPTFLDRLSNYKALRFMDWMRTNTQTQQHWSQRTQPNYRTMASDNGVAYEYMIKLCNTLGTDPWISVPHLATDDYVHQLAKLFRDNLNPALSVYVEHSNEVWNGSYPQASYAQQRGIAMGLSSDPYLAGARYHSVRSVQIFDIFKQEFGSQSGRVQRVLAAQHDNPWIGRQIMDYQNAYQKADCVAVAPYFGYYLGLPGQANATAGMTIDQILTAAENDMLNNRRNLTIECANDAAARGLRLIAYEGGQHLVGVGSAMENSTLTSKFQQANRDSKMGDLYQQDLNIWAEAGGDLFVEYSSAGRYTVWGSWGTFEWQNQAISTAPKYAAIQDFISAGGSEPPVLRQYTGSMNDERLGFNVASAGDVDADGKVDILVSGPRASVGATNGGHVYVYSGTTGALIFYKVGNVAGEQFGYSAVAAGDLDADGYGDIIIGAFANGQNGANAGKVYVYSGRTKSLLYTILGAGANHRFGFSLARLGDVNGDGRSDFAVGAWGANSTTGRVTIHSGLNGSVLRTINGQTAGERFGYALAGPGDVTGDNVPDVVIGAPWGKNLANVETGRAYAFHANSGALYQTRYGTMNKERFGRSVAWVGDVNGDGRSDYAVGGFKSNEGGVNSGKAYIFSGTGPTLFTQTGASQNHRFGLSITGIGDVNFDGRADFAIGAHKAGGSGRVYVYAGGTYETLAVYRGDFLGDKFGHCINALGDINNDGRPDFVVGAWGNSSGSYHAGRAYVVSGLMTSASQALPVAGYANNDWWLSATEPMSLEELGVAGAGGSIASPVSPATGSAGGISGTIESSAFVDAGNVDAGDAIEAGDSANGSVYITAHANELNALALELLSSRAAQRGLLEIEQAAGAGVDMVVRNSTLMSPFEFDGNMQVNGDYVQTVRGALAIHIADADSGAAEFLDIAGQAKLNGTLVLTVDDALLLNIGDEIQLLSASNVTGSFRYVLTPVTASGVTFRVDVREDGVFARVVPVEDLAEAMDLAAWLAALDNIAEMAAGDAATQTLPIWLQNAVRHTLVVAGGN